MRPRSSGDPQHAPHTSLPPTHTPPPLSNPPHHARVRALPLHSLLGPAQQREVFSQPPPGVRKVVLATNIAETAVTIPDTTVVLDSCRSKEKAYDPYAGVNTLQSGWIPRWGGVGLEGVG